MGAYARKKAAELGERIYKGEIHPRPYRNKKGTACEYLYQKIGVDNIDTYAFGDGINDCEMFDLVGHGIAMGNAVDALKSMAEYITDDVDHQGIVKAFQKYFHIQ